MSVSAPNGYEAPVGEEVFALFGALLEEEREALRHRDVERIGTLSRRKEELLSELTQIIDAARARAAEPRAARETHGAAPLADRLRWLDRELRRNGALLSFARDSVQGAIETIERAGALRRPRLRVIG